jgi:O-acetyl-ADP-ribose deacetylase (regulator of RNase III)
MIEIIAGDLLDAKEQYIAHQCNCVSQGASGVAAAIFNKFPYADCYSNRTQPDKAGIIKIFGNGQDQRYVINMFAQVLPGKYRHTQFCAKRDSMIDRFDAFEMCLFHISQIEGLENVAFPFRIGCGLAGGNWEGTYLPMLTRFADEMKEKNVRVVIYQREGDE